MEKACVMIILFIQKARVNKISVRITKLFRTTNKVYKLKNPQVNDCLKAQPIIV
jgi:hypothetical protein